MRRTTTILTALTLTVGLALPAMADDPGFTRCLAVRLDNSTVVETVGDTQGDEITYTVGDGLVTFTTPAGPAVATFDDTTVDVSACTDGQTFTSGPIEGQDAAWTTSDNQTVEAEPEVAMVAVVEISTPLTITSPGWAGVSALRVR